MLKKFALLALLAGNQLGSEEPKTIDYNSENEGYYLMSEEELFQQINSETKKLYDSLSPEGKQLALQVASQRCQSANACKGLGACKSEKNSCAGKNSCKGQGVCAHGDKNLAVRLVAKQMAEKRDALVK